MLATGCAYARMYVQFVSFSIGEWGLWGQLVYNSTCCLSWGVIFDRRENRSVVCVFSICNAGGSVYGCMCVYTRTYTHCTDGVLDVSPGVEMRHLEGPKNPDGLNLGIHIFVYVYKVHMCMYMGNHYWSSPWFSNKQHYLYRERDCFYYIIEQTYDVGLHSRRHPMEFDVGTRPFASFDAPSS